MDVPVQYFQSVITIELAVSGALLWQMRFFESSTARRENEPLPDARLRVALALVLGATLFGSLWAMVDEGPKWAALAVTIGLAVSLVPILLRCYRRWRRTRGPMSAIPTTRLPLSGCSCMSSLSPAFSCCSTSNRGPQPPKHESPQRQ
jgi:hypothetical protein